MIFLRLILTNLQRHRVRTLIGITGIAFSVAAMLTVVTILQGAIGMFEHILSNDSEFIVFERNVSDLFFSSVPDEAVRQLSQWNMVEHAHPVLFGIVSSADHPIITCFGVMADDARIHNTTWLAGNRDDFANNKRGVVLGERAAEFLKAKVGAEIPIGRETFPVIGILKTANGFEDGGVFMPLVATQQFFHKEGLSSVATVKLKSGEDKAAFRQAVSDKYPALIALENEEFSRSYSQFKILRATAWAVGCCGLILGGLGIANTMIMSVFTRIREIAILRVNGFSNVQITGLILGESALVSAVGAVAGLVVGGMLVVALKFVPMLHGYVDAHMQASVVLAVGALACLTGIVGALYPAFYALRIRPVEALRFE
ncbi:MAG: ABC-type transport system, involved in lipoprotein release, permease component [Pedosphaera sp.]|nr:ABC-type transport system, involved in lipoprotein release, permease component [Pedosphaera sp.]